MTVDFACVGCGKMIEVTSIYYYDAMKDVCICHKCYVDGVWE